MLRDPAVAGMFYEADAYALKKHVNEYIVKKEQKFDAKGIVVPHAGYIYSGKVAGEVYSSINIPDVVIIMGPNHTGMGQPISIMSEGVWRTPLGDVKINQPLANDILSNSGHIKKDTAAHLKEHSIEVQLPFLQEIKKNFSFVPIIFGEYNIGHLKDVAEAISTSVKGRDGLLIASTDLTHYEDSKSAHKKDSLVLEAIEKLDESELLNVVQEHDISMCGWMPTFVMIHACKLLGAKQAKIIKYMNSGDSSGDYSQVVGYGGAVII